MTKADDRILEYLETEAKATPGEMAADERISYDKQYVQQRLGKLLDAGLITRVHRGVYTLSEKGSDYLQAEADLQDEPEPR